jgi:hypothetical protein
MAMWRSTDRILTTHGGNLPRPADLDSLIASWQGHQPQIEERLPSAVKEVVDKQVECGVAILNDGEFVKAARRLGPPARSWYTGGTGLRPGNPVGAVPSPRRRAMRTTATASPAT